ncbi:MAG: hypothetical protein NTV31_02960 [Bacteroidia bacterium]|nr:hypothetical protein [Bacteroidia bacterium]
MTKLILITGLLIIPSFICAQEFKESDLDKLLLAPGKVNTYYSKGCETKAKYFQELVQDAVLFYENKLQDTFEIKLLVLNKSDWKLFVGGSYFLTGRYEKRPDRIIMGINELYKIKLADNKILYGEKEAFFWDLIAVHELGHYISHRNKLYVLPWMGEFFADYIQLGFLSERIPDWQYPSQEASTLFKYLPFKYKSLEDFGNNMNRIDPVNYSFYEGKLSVLANNIFEKRGWNFMYEYLERFKIKPTIDKELLYQKFISDFKEMEPEIFNDWLLGMRKTYHPYLVFFILFAIIVFVRFFDNSYSIFTNLGLKTKKRFRIFSVPTFSILTKIKSLENSKIKRKLKLIMGLRPIAYLCLFLFILLLILHH